MEEARKCDRRVLMVTSVFPRFEGDATPPFVFNLGRAIANRGWKVSVLAPHGEGAAWRESWGGMSIRRFPYAFPLRLEKLCYEGGMLINLRKRPWTKLLLPFFFIAQAIAVMMAVLRFRPNVIHSHSLLPQGLVCSWVAMIFRIPHVTTSHGNDVFGLKQSGLMGRLKTFALSSSDTITVNSEATRAAVLKLANVERKVVLVPAVPNEDVPDEEFVEELRSVRGKTDGSVILYVGRIIEEKGIEDFLGAVAGLISKHPKLRAWIVGEGQDRARFESLARKLNIQDKVDWVGWVPPTKVSSWMAAADILVVPSRESSNGWKEAQGLVIVESMRVGTPVVASAVGGIPDMVKDGETGWLFEQRNIAALVKTVDRVLPLEKQEVAERAKELYAKHYSSVSIVDKLELIYDELIR